MALELEHRFNKQQIFELYANEIYLGNRGSFAIHGFGEASLAYFNKDLREVSLPEAAFLAGIIHALNLILNFGKAAGPCGGSARSRTPVVGREWRDFSCAGSGREENPVFNIVGGGLEGSTAPFFHVEHGKGSFAGSLFRSGSSFAKFPRVQHA